MTRQAGLAIPGPLDGGFGGGGVPMRGLVVVMLLLAGLAAHALLRW